MEKTFHSLDELRAEIYLLKNRQKDQEEVIAAKFSSPSAIFSTAVSLFKGKKSDGQKSALEGFLSQDIITSVSRVVLPFLVNNILLRRSGFITKIIASFLTQKAAKNVNAGILSDVVGKVKSLFGSKPSKNKAAVATRGVRDYGIPPDSETY